LRIRRTLLVPLTFSFLLEMFQSLLVLQWMEDIATEVPCLLRLSRLSICTIRVGFREGFRLHRLDGMIAF